MLSFKSVVASLTLVAFALAPIADARSSTHKSESRCDISSGERSLEPRVDASSVDCDSSSSSENTVFSDQYASVHICVGIIRSAFASSPSHTEDRSANSSTLPQPASSPLVVSRPLALMPTLPTLLSTSAPRLFAHRASRSLRPSSSPTQLPSRRPRPRAKLAQPRRSSLSTPTHRTPASRKAKQPNTPPA